jgi:hypothetical protein
MTLRDASDRRRFHKVVSCNEGYLYENKHVAITINNKDLSRAVRLPILGVCRAISQPWPALITCSDRNMWGNRIKTDLLAPGATRYRVGFEKKKHHRLYKELHSN